MRLVAIDTNIFIYFFGTDPKYGPLARELFIQLDRNQLQGVTSIMSLHELLSLEAELSLLDHLKNAFWDLNNLTVVDISSDIAEKAAEIRRKYHFKSIDALQLATAVIHQADFFVTNDKQLTRYKEIKVKLLTDL